MYPRTLLADEVKSPGEVKVFDVLRDGLDDEWEVFHSVGLISRDPATGARDGEIDFVLVHAERGVVCLEVKGGDIECRHGEWLRHTPAGLERVKDPFAQVVEHKHTLRRRLGELSDLDVDRLMVAHGVVFPHIPVHSLVLGPDAPPGIVLDRNDLSDVAASLERVIAFHRGARDRRAGPGRQGATAVRDLLAPTVTIRTPLAERFLAEEQALVELTREQSLLLSRLSRNPRMAIYGCAGSGKTMLAVEHAKRLASQGSSVLFVCFNRALAAHLATTERHDQLTFTNFHRLCVRMARKAGIELPDYPADATPPEFFLDELPQALVDAIDALGAQWDALIVDEAQDLHDHWLTALRYGLRDEEHAPVWLFLDDNQRVYEARLSVPRDFFRWELSTNCRNTQAIHRVLLDLYDGGIEPDVRGPEGRAPELLHAADQPRAVAAVLDRLVGDDDVRPQDIVVLSAHGKDGSQVAAELSDRLVDEPPKRGSRAVRFASIRGFKGLESPVVVLCELEDIDAHTRDQQLYVGLSRARNHCVIVAPPAAG